MDDDVDGDTKDISGCSVGSAANSPAGFELNPVSPTVDGSRTSNPISEEDEGGKETEGCTVSLLGFVSVEDTLEPIKLVIISETGFGSTEVVLSIFDVGGDKEEDERTTDG